MSACFAFLLNLSMTGIVRHVHEYARHRDEHGRTRLYDDGIADDDVSFDFGSPCVTSECRRVTRVEASLPLASLQDECSPDASLCSIFVSVVGLR